MGTNILHSPLLHKKIQECQIFESGIMHAIHALKRIGMQNKQH